MDENAILNAVKNKIENSKKAFLCRNCAHRNVCKKIEDKEEKCGDFMDATTYKQYASIYHFFDPIFDWIKFHYPAGEVKFIVDHNSAKMFLEYKPCVFSKEINQFLFQPQNQDGKKND